MFAGSSSEVEEAGVGGWEGGGELKRRLPGKMPVVVARRRKERLRHAQRRRAL